MTSPELAAAMVAAYDDRYDRTGPLEDPVAPCLAAAVLVMVEKVVPDEPEPKQSAMPFSDWNLKVERWDARLLIRRELLALVDALEAL